MASPRASTRDMARDMARASTRDMARARSKVKTPKLVHITLQDERQQQEHYLASHLLYSCHQLQHVVQDVGLR